MRYYNPNIAGVRAWGSHLLGWDNLVNAAIAEGATALHIEMARNDLDGSEYFGLIWLSPEGFEMHTFPRSNETPFDIVTWERDY